MTTDNITDTALDTTEVEVKNPAALLAKNRALLKELAEVKSELQAANQALEAQTQRADTMGTELHDMRVLTPWRAELAGLVGAGTVRLLERGLSDHLDVVAGEDGGPSLVGKDGDPLQFKDGKPVSATWQDVSKLVHELAENGQDDMRPLLPRAVGCGATGNDGRGYRYAAPKPDPKRPAGRATPSFGLR